jgi:DNA-directed RNA polymerase subunit RPC12/RpoP
MTYIVTQFYCAECDQLYTPPGRRGPSPTATHMLICEDCGSRLQVYDSYEAPVRSREGDMLG